MEAATPLHRQPHSVTPAGDRVRIDGLTIVDEVVARLASESDDPARVIEDAVAIGARVLDREQAGANAEFVKTEFERVAKTVEAEFGEKARLASEQLDRQLAAVFDPEHGQLAKSLTELFSDGSSTAVQNRVRDQIRELLTGNREDLLKLFSATDGSNPLTRLSTNTVQEIQAADKRQREGQAVLLGRVHELEKQLQGIRDEKQKLEEVAEERERGTAKGRSYEESVAEAVDAIAAVHGDVAEPVGDEAGAGGKRGDVVVTVDGATGSGCGRIVFEAKDRRLSKQQFESELEEAMTQRSAGYAILVVPDEDAVPAKLHSLREHFGDKLIAVFDADEGATLELEFAYRMARARIVMSGQGAEDVDAAAVRVVVERAQSAMEETRRIKQQLTSAETSIGTAKGILDGMAKQVRGHLAEMDDMLLPADGQGELAV